MPPIPPKEKPNYNKVISDMLEVCCLLDCLDWIVGYELVEKNQRLLALALDKAREVLEIIPRVSKEIRQHKDISKSEKVAYVKSQTQTRDHSCHWPGCKKQVPPAMWGCYKHWTMLPSTLKARLWASYRPGQEKTMTPSREYVEVAREVQQWIKENYNV